MLKIGLLGYGKMGKAIEQIAENQAVEFIWRISRENAHTLTPELLKSADVVIEFSRPEIAFQHVMACLEAGVPVVSGTTGWAAELPKAQQYCIAQNGALLWASNFSIGVNLFFALNRYLSRLMSSVAQYQPSITEIHHIHKLDAPSGTAITLAHDICDQSGRFSSFHLEGSGSPAGSIPITAIREGEVPGTHIIQWKGPVDEINIEHVAHSRAGFAWGALTAAMWIKGKQGVFTMNDVLNIT